VKVVAGFAENQQYGLGTNSMTESQKSLLIYGALALFFLLFLAGRDSYDSIPANVSSRSLCAASGSLQQARPAVRITSASASHDKHCIKRLPVQAMVCVWMGCACGCTQVQQE
jgi:hypothetical protein